MHQNVVLSDNNYKSDEINITPDRITEEAEPQDLRCFLVAKSLLYNIYITNNNYILRQQLQIKPL